MFDLLLQWLFFPLVMRYVVLLLRAFLYPLWASNLQCSIVDHLCGFNGSEGFIFLLLVFLFGLVEHLCIFDNAHLFYFGRYERLKFLFLLSNPFHWQISHLPIQSHFNFCPIKRGKIDFQNNLPINPLPNLPPYPFYTIPLFPLYILLYIRG